MSLKRDHLLCVLGRILARASALSAALVFGGIAHAQVNGFDNGTNFTVNGTASFSAPNTVNITNDIYGEANSVYFDTPVNAGAFSASFVYDLASFPVGDGFSPADGFTFVLQDDARGTSAVGDAGGNLGYAGNSPVTPSVAVAFNVYYQNPIGTTLLTDGSYPRGYNSVLPVNLLTDPVSVSLGYSGGVLTESLVDLTTSATWSTSYSVDIPGTLGSSMAYVGFTGGDASGTSVQQISNFQYQAVPEPRGLLGLGASLVGLGGFRLRNKTRVIRA